MAPDLTHPLKREWIVFGLLLLFLPACLLLGAITDFALVQLYARAEGLALPSPSLLVYENLAGYRGLAIEAMLGCWLALAIWTFALISRRLASPALRLSFLTGLAAATLLAVFIFLAIIYACLMPFDFMLIRVDQPPVLHMVLHAIVLVELLAASFFLVRAVKGHPRRPDPGA
jgi:hypothetical protein